MTNTTDMQLAQMLHRLARDHPGDHPYTLSLYLQVQTGVEITGRKAKELMNAYPEQTA